MVYDSEKDKTIELITNQFTWTAHTIGELYKARWEIVIFFNRDQTATEYQIVSWDFCQCRSHSNLDSNNYNADYKVPESQCEVHLVPVKYGGVSAINLLCEGGSKKLMDTPFEPPGPSVEPTYKQAHSFKWWIKSESVKKS